MSSSHPRNAVRLGGRGLLVLILTVWGLATQSRAAVVAFTGVVEIEASVGTDPNSFELLSVPVSGLAHIDGGVVRIAASAIHTAVPNLANFGGTLVNGAATFSVGGAGPGSTCPLIEMQEVCIDGGGFGGVMALGGVTHAGQALSVWGIGGSQVGMTTSGLSRTEEGLLHTAGRARAFYYIPETDPTPFAITKTGSFRGLPSTFTGTGVAGFSLVTPMVVTANLPTSGDNARAVAILRIDFNPQSVPLGGTSLLALLLVTVGLVRLRPSDKPRRQAPNG